MKLARILTTLALAGITPLASASIIASDDFTYGVGALGGNNGGTGWAGAWSAVAAALVVDPASDLSGDRAVRFTSNDNNAAYRQLATSFSGPDLYVDFLVQVAAGSVTANDFMALWLDTVATGDHTSRPNLGIKADRGTSTPGDDLFVRTTGTAGNFVTGSDFVNGTTYHIVGHLYKLASTNYNRFDIWLNPQIGDLAAPNASFSGSSGISAVSHIGLRTANLDAGDQVLVDRLRLGTTWNDLMSVPEPDTLPLAGLALLAGLAARRRRR